MHSSNGEPIGSRKIDDRRIIRKSGAKLCGEFCGGQIMMKSRADWIIDIPQQIGKFLRISQWQTNGQSQLVCTRQMSYPRCFPLSHHPGNVTKRQLFLRRKSRS